MRSPFAQAKMLLVMLAFTALATPMVRAEQGFFSTYEHLFLDSKISNQGTQRVFYVGRFNSLTESEGGIESPLEYASRLTVGYEGRSGCGIQARWFSFDEDQTYTGRVREGGLWIDITGGTTLEVEAVDFELSQRGRFGVWDWLATGGVRYVDLGLQEQEINFEVLSDFAWSGNTGYEFEGTGPTFSLMGLRNIGQTGLSVYGRGRTALLFGDLEHASAFRTSGRYTVADEFMQIWEFQLGANFEANLGCVDLLSGIFWETQRWDSDSDLFGDLAFNGFGVTTGIRF